MNKKKFEDMSYLNLGKSMSNFLEKEGHSLKLSFNGGEKPEKYNGYYPDIIAKKDNKEIFIEVVTVDYLKIPENLEEVKQLSKYVASQPDENIKFYLIVPKKEYDKIKKIITSNNIYVNSFYFINL